MEATYLANLLGLRVPLCAVLVVLRRDKLAKQKENLRDNNAREVLVLYERAVSGISRRAGRAHGAGGRE